jgi:hypothetical protein
MAIGGSGKRKEFGNSGHQWQLQAKVRGRNLGTTLNQVKVKNFDLALSHCDCTVESGKRKGTLERRLSSVNWLRR